MKNLFKKCELLENIEGIQNWEINELRDISRLFIKCYKLQSLPNLSLWEKKHIIYKI